MTYTMNKAPLTRAYDWFWAWYERHYLVNVALASALFTLQIVHLVWLTFDPLWTKLLGEPLFTIDDSARWLIIFVDYTEVPALVSVSLVYMNEFRKGFALRPVVYLFFLNIQWLHIFWITDEFVVESSSGDSTTLPKWLALVAIVIDYLELPVIVDTLRKLTVAVVRRGDPSLANDDLEEEAGA
jgi:hypothetical protein